MHRKAANDEPNHLDLGKLSRKFLIEEARIAREEIRRQFICFTHEGLMYVRWVI